MLLIIASDFQIFYIHHRNHNSKRKGNLYEIVLGAFWSCVKHAGSQYCRNLFIGIRIRFQLQASIGRWGPGGLCAADGFDFILGRDSRYLAPSASPGPFKQLTFKDESHDPFSTGLAVDDISNRIKRCVSRPNW